MNSRVSHHWAGETQQQACAIGHSHAETAMHNGMAGACVAVVADTRDSDDTSCKLRLRHCTFSLATIVEEEEEAKQHFDLDTTRCDDSTSGREIRVVRIPWAVIRSASARGLW